MSKALVLSREQRLSLEWAAGFCTKLAAAENAHLLGETERLDTIMQGVDPIEARLVANALHGLCLVWDTLPDIDPRGGSTGGPLPGEPTLATACPPTTAGADGESAGPTAPSNVYDFDRWSVRCS